MKSKKQRRKELKDTRTAKQAKREITRCASRIPFRPEHRIAACREALSEESQRSYCVPAYYKDEYYKCFECGKESLFSAEQQKEWYEVKKRHLHQRPNRCHLHFMQWCSGRKTKFRMDKALEKLRLAPDSKEALRDYALSIVEFHKSNGKGNLNTAIHILRQLKEYSDVLEYCTEQIQKAIQAKKEKQEFIELLRSEATCAFNKSSGKFEEIQAAIIQCLLRGYEAGLDVSELRDILIEGFNCIIRQAEIPEADEIVVREQMIYLINNISHDYESRSIPDAIERHKKRIREWYDNWINNH